MFNPQYREWPLGVLVGPVLLLRLWTREVMLSFPPPSPHFPTVGVLLETPDFLAFWVLQACFIWFNEQKRHTTCLTLFYLASKKLNF